MIRIVLCATLLIAAPAAAGDLTSYMRDGIPGATWVPRYSHAESEKVAGQVLSGTVSLTPNAPYAADGSHLDIWKPSFVSGTADGGEIGVNFWNLHNGGHVNVSLAPSGRARLADCRVVGAGAITYKIYAGDAPAVQNEVTPHKGHVWVVVPPAADTTTLVELWPSPVDTPTGYLGCDISVIG